MIRPRPPGGVPDRRLVVRIDRVVVEGHDGLDLRTLEADVRGQLAAALADGHLPPAFARDATVLTATRPATTGLGTAIASATAPPRRTP